MLALDRINWMELKNIVCALYLRCLNSCVDSSTDSAVQYFRMSINSSQISLVM